MATDAVAIAGCAVVVAMIAGSLGRARATPPLTLFGDPLDDPGRSSALAERLGERLGSLEAPSPEEGRGFDRVAATSALAAVDVESCARPDGPTGLGHVTLTFRADGLVGAATIEEPPFAGTSVGACVAREFRRARVRPFAGPPVTVGKVFAVLPCTCRPSDPMCTCAK